MGEILYIDQYGNSVTNIPLATLPHAALRRSRGPVIPEAASYQTIPKGKAGLIRGSHGFWEIACRESSAAGILKLKLGASIALIPST